MPEVLHNPHPDGSRDEGRQAADINVRVLALGAVILTVVAALAFVFLYWLFGRFDAQLAHDQFENRNSSITRTLGPPANAPPLQGIPGYHNNSAAEDMVQMKHETDALLNSYGPADAQGFARIPINRAMDLAIHDHRFPARAEPITKGAADETR